MRALAGYPDQFARLKSDPTLLAFATEETIRWVTPVKAFMRIVAATTTIRDVAIAAGSPLMSYASANRDEDVFDKSQSVSRLAKSDQAHCLRARRPILPRRHVGSHGSNQPLSHCAPTPGVGIACHRAADIATTFVGGLKHVPIKFQMT